MKTAEEWAKELTDKWEVGNSSQFCDETDWDSASIEEVNAFIKQIQLDAFKAGMTEAAEIAHSNNNYCTAPVEILSARDKKESL